MSEPTKKGPRRSPLLRERQRLECLDLYLAGEWQIDIAKKLRMSQSQVSRDIKAAHEEWAKRTTYNLDEQKAKRLAEIDRLERQYQQGWQRSCGKTKTTSTKSSQGGVGDLAMVAKGDKISLQPAVIVETTTKTEKLIGDSSFLNGIAWCISERCKILGTYAATKQVTATAPAKLLLPAQIDAL